MVGIVPTSDIAKLQVNQTARIKVIGAGEVDGKVRRLSTTVEPNSQLAQVFLGITPNRRLLVNSSGRAQIKTGQSCGVSVPLTAILYGSAGTVVQVVRRARGDRADVGRTGRDHLGAGRGRHRRGPRRRTAARGRSGARGDGERRSEITSRGNPPSSCVRRDPYAAAERMDTLGDGSVQRLAAGCSQGRASGTVPPR